MGDIKKRIALCCGILLITAVVAVVIWVGRNNVPERIMAIITENRDAYDYVAEFYYADFLTDKQDCAAYSFLTDDVVYRYQMPFEANEIVLDDKEIKLFERVKDSYYLDKHGIDRVYVYGNFVSLCNANGREALVYSVDGTKPEFVNTPDDNFSKILAVKVVDNWYYVTGK